MYCLFGSANAATIEEAFVVSPDESISIEFPVEETGTIYAEIVEFTGPLQQLGLVLEYPTGERKEVWWWEVGMPLSLTHKVSEEDIKTGQDWKISVTYRGGPYPDYAGTSVSYGANAYDKAGNRAWTDYRNVHISEPMTPPTVIEHAPTGENVPVTTQITVTFSELMNTDSVESVLYVYDSNQVRVTGEFSWEDL